MKRRMQQTFAVLEKGKTMSDEYIEKEDAIQSIIAHDLVGGDARGWAEYLLENTSTADVAPVRHGRWTHITFNELTLTRCSKCGFQQSGLFEPNYCPNCGAKMDGGEDE